MTALPAKALWLGLVIIALTSTQGQELPKLYEHFMEGEISSGLVAANKEFRLNGKYIRLIGGAMHYFRIHPNKWRDRLRKLRAIGANAVETYVSWNLHEPRRGEFDFGAGNNDFSEFMNIRRFIEMAQEEDLLVILRPGPYICAEWEWGGFPGESKIPLGQSSLKIICIQMELCGQDLRKWLGEQRVVDMSLCRDIFLQIVAGMEHIHKQGIIHRDLKPENIFLTQRDKSLVVQIGDLGIATGHVGVNSDNHTASAGTRLYFAPEQEGNRYSKAVDIYALGIILFELLNPALQPTANYGSFSRLYSSITDLKYNQKIPIFVTSRWPKECQLILKLTSVHPQDRPDFTAIRNSLGFPAELAKSPPPAKSPNLVKGVEGLKLVDKADVPPKPFGLARPAAFLPSQGIKKVPAPVPVLVPVLAPVPVVKMGKMSQTCHQCKALLVTMESYLDEARNVICGPCHGLNVASTCVKCNKVIVGNQSIYKGQKWHPHCMKCSACSKLITSFFNKDGQLYCHDCNNRLFAPKCSNCKKPITETIRQFEGSQWHDECFKCNICKGKIGNERFVKKDGLIYCISCKNEKLSPKCTKCRQPILSERYTNYEGQPWHSECFTCYNCKTPIAGQSFYKKDSQRYCTHCHTSKFGRR